MRIGLCGSMVVQDLRLGGSEVAPLLARAGYDYIELSLVHLTRLDDTTFKGIIRDLRNAGIPCECCNNFFPPELSLTGHGSDINRTKEYALKAINRAKELGVRVIVLGSGQSRMVPADFPLEKAWSQLVDLCRIAGELAERNSIRIVLEPLRKEETNIINSVQEALQLNRDVARKNIGVLADYYHMVSEKESPEILMQAASDLGHIHFSNPAGRVFPVSRDEDGGYEDFFHSLKMINYQGRISVEAYSDNLEEDAGKTLRFLKGIIQ